MNVLLINPLHINARLPQGLLFLASAVKNHGHDVIVYDENEYVDTPYNILETYRSLKRILSFQISVIGISVITDTYCIERSLFISKELKKNNPNATIIWGGWHPTMFTKDVVRFNDIDIIIKGPAEKTMNSLLDSIENEENLEEKYDTSENKIIIEENNDLKQDDLFPELRFDLINLRRYILAEGEGALDYLFTRGCIYKCTFCSGTLFYKNNIYRKKKEHIIRELRYIYQHAKFNTLFIQDDFTIRNDNEASELYEIIKSAEVKLHLACSTRVSSINAFSDETFMKLKECGLYGFSVGIESGSERILKEMKKGNTVSTILKAIDRLKQMGITRNTFNFIFNYPGEDEEDKYASLRLVGLIKRKLPNSNFSFHICKPTSPYMYESMKFDKIQGNSVSQKLTNYYKGLAHFKLGKFDFRMICFYIHASTDQCGNIMQLKNKFLITVLRKISYIRAVNLIYSFPLEYRIYKLFNKKNLGYISDAYLLDGK